MTPIMEPHKKNDANADANSFNKSIDQKPRCLVATKITLIAVTCWDERLIQDARLNGAKMAIDAFNQEKDMKRETRR